MIHRGVQMLSRAFHVLVVTRKSRRWVLRIGSTALLLALVLQLILAYVIGDDARLLPPGLQRAKKLLVVTAHPGDESLFFAPTILGVLDRNPEVQGALLAISTGNKHGIGPKRKQEMKEACYWLGIGPTRCMAENHPDLQDSPPVWWNASVVQGVVERYVKKWDIDAIITFDAGGVSGDVNHRAVSAAVRKYVSTTPGAPTTFVVLTTSSWRKYTFLFDLPFTAFSYTWRILSAVFFPTDKIGQKQTKGLVVSTWRRYLLTRKALAGHESQYSWDRRFYVFLSRYVWFNDLRKMTTKKTGQQVQQAVEF